MNHARDSRPLPGPDPDLTPEILVVETRRVMCDGASGIRGGAGYRPAALGHPRVWLEIDEKGYVDCGYCDRRFVLQGGPLDASDTGAPASRPDPATDTAMDTAR